MKKKYIMPSMEATEKKVLACLLAGSVISSDKGIGFGGVDTDGVLDPEGKDKTDAEIW